MTLTFHILNGDALLHLFPQQITGEKIIMRECMIDGPCDAEDLSTLFDKRANFFSESYNVSKDEYAAKTKLEINKVLAIPFESDVNLWFEHDLFCQTNLFYSLHLLANNSRNLDINIVYPLPLPENKMWYGFGAMSSDDLVKCYNKREKVLREDLKFAAEVWTSYSQNNIEDLSKLMDYTSQAFPETKNAIAAHLERLSDNKKGSRPHNKIKELLNKYGENNFGAIFKEFQLTEGIYGFGDTQVRAMMNEILKKQ